MLQFFLEISILRLKASVFPVEVLKVLMERQGSSCSKFCQIKGVTVHIHEILHLNSPNQTFFFQTNNLLPSLPKLSDQSFERVITRWSVDVDNLNRFLNGFTFIFLLQRGSVYHPNRLLNAFTLTFLFHWN
jgi:hypothetical protein